MVLRERERTLGLGFLSSSFVENGIVLVRGKMDFYGC